MQQYEACSAGMEISTTVKNTWASLSSHRVDSGDLIWNVCDAPQGMNFPIRGIDRMFEYA